MLDCVTLETNHLFEGNPIASQHKLRYKSIIERQKWDVPIIRGMEYDAYDNPATYYLIWRDDAGIARGLSRLYPTDRPYMLQDVFSFLVTDTELPNKPEVWEGSRFCVDESLDPALRKRIIQEIVVGYLEFGLAEGIEQIIGVMYPAYWRNIFVRSGWNVEWIGEEQRLGDAEETVRGHKVRAGSLPVSKEVLANVRETTGIHTPVLNFGDSQRKVALAA